jgi:hypothetical protein
MRVKSIKKVEPRIVYAVKTSTGTYIADGLAHHNCTGCNMFKQGEQYLYAKALDYKYGEGTADGLMSQRHLTHKFSIDELQQVIDDSKTQIKWYEDNKV